MNHDSNDDRIKTNQTSGAIGKNWRQSEFSFSSSELQKAATGSMAQTSTCNKRNADN